MTHEEYVLRVRSEIASLAQRILNGDESFSGGARKMVALLNEAEFPDDDADRAAFVSVELQGDALPLGPEREEWAQEALAKLQPEIDSFEAFAKEYLTNACRSLFKRFGA